ncbi:hypothetical protein PTSG_00033 [Salpingoeca rosetta]|uniref:Rap-GAP domain-containing protein n=1 Tax=Salpingoeca rosetta (strain ATCC 50818 / BSB-021) TaxID=946362 RepID=F2TVC1_SALR5|nr:uncharacterized protein PTSG_00033 [Salpingoeca rosetta]EGD72017.1 hypothetical protein PTSG_00033 [Salpingoeca rosetta]|eukprot:XP_004998589.1 hypothetical protein PTSG_00033 [Salpingoeca rosetta]
MTSKSLDAVQQMGSTPQQLPWSPQSSRKHTDDKLPSDNTDPQPKKEHKLRGLMRKFRRSTNNNSTSNSGGGGAERNASASQADSDGLVPSPASSELTLSTTVSASTASTANGNHGDGSGNPTLAQLKASRRRQHESAMASAGVGEGAPLELKSLGRELHRHKVAATPLADVANIVHERRLVGGEATDTSTMSIGVEDLSWEEEPGAFLRDLLHQQQQQCDEHQKQDNQHLSASDAEVDGDTSATHTPSTTSPASLPARSRLPAVEDHTENGSNSNSNADASNSHNRSTSSSNTNNNNNSSSNSDGARGQLESAVATADLEMLSSCNTSLDHTNTATTSTAAAAVHTNASANGTMVVVNGGVGVEHSDHEVESNASSTARQHRHAHVHVSTHGDSTEESDCASLAFESCASGLDSDEEGVRDVLRSLALSSLQGDGAQRTRRHGSPLVAGGDLVTVSTGAPVHVHQHHQPGVGRGVAAAGKADGANMDEHEQRRQRAFLMRLDDDDYDLHLPSGVRMSGPSSGDDTEAVADDSTSDVQGLATDADDDVDDGFDGVKHSNSSSGRDEDDARADTASHHMHATDHHHHHHHHHHDDSDDESVPHAEVSVHDATTHTPLHESRKQRTVQSFESDVHVCGGYVSSDGESRPSLGTPVRSGVPAVNVCPRNGADDQQARNDTNDTSVHDDTEAAVLSSHSSPQPSSPPPATASSATAAAFHSTPKGSRPVARALLPAGNAGNNDDNSADDDAALAAHPTDLEMDTALLEHAQVVGLHPLPHHDEQHVTRGADRDHVATDAAPASNDGDVTITNVDGDQQQRQDLSMSDFSFSSHFRSHAVEGASPNTSGLSAASSIITNVDAPHATARHQAPGHGGYAHSDDDEVQSNGDDHNTMDHVMGHPMHAPDVSPNSLYRFHEVAEVPLFRVLPRPSSMVLDESMARHVEELEEALARHSDRLETQRSPFYAGHGYESTTPRGAGQFTSKRFWPYPVPQHEVTLPSRAIDPIDPIDPAHEHTHTAGDGDYANKNAHTTSGSGSDGDAGTISRRSSSIRTNTNTTTSGGSGSGSAPVHGSSGAVATAMRYLQECSTRGETASPVVMRGCEGFVQHARGGTFDAHTLYRFMEMAARYYRTKFTSLPHWNFTGEHQSEPVIVTIGLRNGEQSSREVPNFLCMIRTIRRAYKGDVRPDELSPAPDAAEICRVAFPKLSISGLEAICSDHMDDVRQRLIAVDEHMIRDRFKVALLHVLPGQLDQDSVMANTAEDDSPAYSKFLHGLGDVVPIASFAGYKGDLEGFRESLYTAFDEKEIMFHVVSMMRTQRPQSAAEIRRLVGTSLVSVVFLERGAHFVPKAFNFQLLHVFIVVQESEEMALDSGPLYDIRVVSRDSVPWFDPVIPTQPLPATEMRRWVLNKIVNAELAMQQSGALANVARQAREQQIRSAVADFNAWKFSEPSTSVEMQHAIRSFASSCIVDVSALPSSALCLPEKFVHDIALNHAVEREMQGLRLSGSDARPAPARTLAESKANRSSTIQRRRDIRGVSEGLQSSTSTAPAGHHRSLHRGPGSVSSSSLASGVSEANGGVLVEGRGLNLDHIATLDVHEQVGRLRKLVLTLADERDTRTQEVETLQTAKQELMESNIQLRAEIARLSKALRNSRESFEHCYSENERLARKVADLELELNMPAEV